jgi:hypothetical protein
VRPPAAGELYDLVDVGPVGRVLGRATVGLRVPQLGAVLAAAAVAVVVGVGVSADPDGRRFAAIGLATLVLVGSPAWGRPVGGRLGWLLPGLVRGIEYGLVVRLVAVVHPAAMPAAFGYLCALAYHHYDTVYRWRHTRTGPAPWVFLSGLGHDGRLLVLAALLATDAHLGVSLTVGAILLSALYTAESATAWRAWLTSRPAVT